MALDNPVVTLPGADEVSRAIDGARLSNEQTITDLLVGLDVERATTELESVGWEVRIVSEDGVANDVLLDGRGDRANLAIEAGLVVDEGSQRRVFPRGMSALKHPTQRKHPTLGAPFPGVMWAGR